MSRGYRDRDSGGYSGGGGGGGGYRDRDRDSGTRVYIGQLPDDAKKEELEKELGHYGRLNSVWVARNPPGFAFVEFEDKRDAEDAVSELDGRKLCGETVKVEIASGRRRGGGGGRRGGGGYGGGGGRGYGGGGGFRDKSNEKCFNCGEKGHFARDCRSSGGGGGGGGGRSYGGGGGGDRYGGRSYSRRSRSRSRSNSPRRSYHHSRSKSLSPKD